LLVKGNAPALELHHQRILIKLFVEAMSQFVQHLKCTTDNRVGFLFARAGVCPSGVQIWKIICVHLRLSAVVRFLRFGGHGFKLTTKQRKMKAPSSNTQAPEKHQASSPKLERALIQGFLEFDVWNFSGVWCLEFGA
jgi:hypothetical protein